MCVTNTVGRKYYQVLSSRSQLSLAPTQANLSLDIPVVPETTQFTHCDIEEPARNKNSKADTTHAGARKLRPRRHLPLNPGKTAKNNDRHFVVHSYHDHATDDLDSDVKIPVLFPMKLHQVLDDIEHDGLDYIVSWAPHGRSFMIHKPTEFVSQILPRYFRQSKITSFQRQLNLYNFNRLTRGIDKGGYYSEFFLRGKPALCKYMIRTKIKGTGFKAAGNPDQEPDFYSIPPLVSDCGSIASDVMSEATSDNMMNIGHVPDVQDVDLELEDTFSVTTSVSCSNLSTSISSTQLYDDIALFDMVDELFFKETPIDVDMIDMFCTDKAPFVIQSKDWHLDVMLQRLVD